MPRVRDYRLLPNHDEIEQRLEDWANWMRHEAQGMGWNVRLTETGDGVASRGNTIHSDPIFWEIWQMERRGGNHREYETDSILRSMPAIWRKLIAAAYLGNMGVNLLAQHVGLPAERVRDFVEASYWFMRAELDGRSSARADEANRGWAWLGRLFSPA